MSDLAPDRQALPWYRRWRRVLGASIKLRLVLLFLLLAAAMTAVFVGGAQKAFSLGWREAARPLLMDYVDHLAADITRGGATPIVDEALALTRRLPITVGISGPTINWLSHPDQQKPHRRFGRINAPDADGWQGEGPWRNLLRRTTDDGHTLVFGIDETLAERRPRLLGVAIGAVLLLSLLAWLYVRRLLRPLDVIRNGAQRFGAGDFTQPIAVPRPVHPDELGQLAVTINKMGQDINQMLEAKRALLLAISHELRSPLTRARVNTELLPETDQIDPQRKALLRDLQEMARLVTDLLESERLSGNHAALQREPVGLATLAAEVVQELLALRPGRDGKADTIVLQVDETVTTVSLDPTRIRLLIRNLLDNALRHGGSATQAPELSIRNTAQGVQIDVRDFGPGVHDDQLPHLAEAFYRPESARTRATGGVGLGLHLCKLIAQAHGGTFDVRNALPGLAISVTLPGSQETSRIVGGSEPVDHQCA